MTDEIDPTTPSPARMYDYVLGGTANYAVDRRASEEMLKAWPEVRPLALHNRQFLTRVVRYIADAGVDQFLDLGSGLPTQENVHQIAQSVNPAARVVYVDHDPIVLAHGRALLADDASTTYVAADLCDHGTVLSAAARLLDMSRPVALLATSTLHYVDGAREPARVMERYISGLAPGSHVAIAHVTGDGVDPALQEAAAAVHRGNQHLRTAAEIEAMFGGLDLVEPGLVDVERWRAAQEPGPLRILGGVAVKR